MGETSAIPLQDTSMQAAQGAGSASKSYVLSNPAASIKVIAVCLKLQQIVSLTQNGGLRLLLFFGALCRNLSSTNQKRH